jgi:hypothetical protein
LEDVELTATMQRLIGNDEQQDYLHRILAVNEDPEGKVPLSDHVQNVLDILIDSYPDKALQKFEEVSTCLKVDGNVDKFLKTKEVRDYRDVAKDTQEFSEKASALFPKPKKTGDDDDDAANDDDPQPVCYI